jgi:hypothetical protein
MATCELEKQDHMRSEFKRIPPEYLPEEIGTVKDSTPEQPADTNPFEGDSPFPMSPYLSSFVDENGVPLDPKSFEERLEAALEFIPIGAEINFDEMKNGIVLED